MGGAGLSDEEHARVAELLSQRPGVTLRFYGRPEGVDDLAFLRHYPKAVRVAIDLWELKRLRGIEHLSRELVSLSLGQTKSKSLSLDFLERFPGLEKLWLEGHRKDIAAISCLQSLRELTLRSVTIPDLTVIRDLANLRAFKLHLGGAANLEGLSTLAGLRYLEIWQVRGLSDLTSIDELKSLTHLFLQSLARVTALPDLKRLERLRWVAIENLKELNDFGPLAGAPALEEVWLSSMRHVALEDLQPLVGHPTLRAATIGLGSLRRNREASELLGVTDDAIGISEAYAEAIAS